MRYSLFAFILFSSAFLSADSNIDPQETNNQYAYTENAGWVDLQGDNTNGIEVGISHLQGYAWNENIGWIFFGDGTPENGVYYSNAMGSDVGVNRQNGGALTGWAYSETVSFISMDTSSVGGSQVVIDPATGVFSGYAWRIKNDC